MKGIVLAAGKGTRLYPMTKPVSKPLLPVYDKPLIYYPIAILMQAGISDIMVIVPPGETGTFRALLGDGAQYGLKITFAEQPVARGIADALLIGREFVGEDRVCLVLGDNIFYAPSLGETLKAAAANCSGATVFGYWVEDPRPFGVVEFGADGRAISIEEKPRHPKSNYIIPGQLRVVPLERDFTWLDAGTADSLLIAGQTIKRIQDQTGRYVGCLEELGLREGWVTAEQVHKIGDELSMTLYGKYLQCL